MRSVGPDLTDHTQVKAVLCVNSGDHVPGDASVVAAPPLAICSTSSHRLRDIRGLDADPPPDSETPDQNKMYKS